MSGQEVTFLERDSTVDAIRKSGLKLILGGREHLIQKITVVPSIDQAMEMPRFDVGILAIKSFDTEAFIETITPFKRQLPVILCLQNGVENEDLLRQALGKNAVISGSVTSAVGRINVGQIILEKLRGVGIAGEHPLVDDLLKIFNGSGLNAKKYQDETSMKWSKLLTNLLANASAAILNMLPAEIYSIPGLFALEMLQLREAMKVMEAIGCKVIDLPSTPVRLLAMGARLPFSISQPLMKNLLGKGRGNKKPSLMIDLQRDTRHSEVEFLNGAVARFGKKLGVVTPVNQFFTETLLSLIGSEEQKNSFDHHPEKLLDPLISLL